jgi:hypothetical protein
VAENCLFLLLLPLTLFAVLMDDADKADDKEDDDDDDCSLETAADP